MSKTDRWASLDARAQFAVALDVARRRGASLRAAFSNVVSVGAGWRSSGADARIHSEVCLRFLVRRKWTERRSRPRKIPAEIVAYALLGQHRIRVRIPTDVSAYPRGAPHAGLNLTAGITSLKDGRAFQFGTACCIVRNVGIPAERYLLSCYHVFSPEMDDAGVPDRSCVRSVDGQMLGDLASKAQILAPNGLDAALVRIDDANFSGASVFGRFPVARATDFDIAELPHRGSLSLLCRQRAPAAAGMSSLQRVEPLAVEFQSLFPNASPFDYTHDAGRIIEFADTIQYLADVQEGDSGSALVDDGGMLYGMHFYGVGRVGFAMSAARLFDSDVFSLDIEL